MKFEKARGVVDLIPLVIIIHTIVSVILIVLVLLHSGKAGGLGGAFGAGGGTFGGTTIIEKNLDRITIVSAVTFVITTIILTKFFR